jgi:hypothetical protein
MKLLFVCLIVLFALSLQQVQPVKSGQTEPAVPAEPTTPTKEPTSGEKPATETPKEPTTGTQEPTPTPTDPKNTPDSPTTSPKIDKKCLVFKSYFNHIITGNVDTRRDVYHPMSEERATDEYKQRAIDHFKTQLKIDLAKDIDGLKLTPVELNPKLKSFIAAAYAEQLPKSYLL